MSLLRHERRIARDKRHEFLVAIHEASDRLAILIDRLLEMSQLDTDAIWAESVVGQGSTFHVWLPM